jgi:hypothetical protein
MYKEQLLAESIAVGLITLLVGTLMTFIVPDNKGLHLVLTGITIHLACEFTGFNRWYVHCGAANESELMYRHLYFQLIQKARGLLSSINTTA